MPSLLRRKTIRIAALVLAFLSLVATFLIWETTIAAIPTSLVEQYAILKSIPAGLWPIIGMLVLTLGFFVIALGPELLQKRAGEYRAWRNRHTRQVEQLVAEKEEAERQRDRLQQRVEMLEHHIATTPRTPAEELRQDCCQLAIELHQFVEECINQTIQFTQAGANPRRNEGVYEWRYETQYLQRAVNLLEKAAERAWTAPSNVRTAQTVDRNVMAMKHVAEILAEIGCRK